MTGSCVPSGSVIQAAFEPPFSSDDISATMIGLIGATWSSLLYEDVKIVEKLRQPGGVKIAPLL